jgi:cell division protein FtsQ
MDGRGRIAEPVMDDALSRVAAQSAPAPRRRRFRARARLGRLEQIVNHRLEPMMKRHWPRGAGIGAATALLLASIVFGVVRGEHLPAIAAELRDWRDAMANAVGFRIASVALAGQRTLSRDAILAAAGITGRTSLLFLDASEVRARLKTNPWIAEATVLKLYPGRLHIAITERTAFALWQKDGKINLIAADGAVLEPYVAKPFVRLPLVVGAGAEKRASTILALIEKYPTVREQVGAAVLVADRRWNLKLKSGIDVRLPEEGIEGALELLVRLDREKQLMSRDITAIDLRLPDRVTVRLSDEAAAQREEALKEKKAKKKAGAA